MKRHLTRVSNDFAIDLGRRKMVSAMGVGAAMALSGCCNLRCFAKPEIGGAKLANTESLLLKPKSINKAFTKGMYCVDAHAHFFNASDVTVGGYLSGPVAHSAGGYLGMLFQLLSPLADELGSIAPTAKAEDEYLTLLESTELFQSAAELEEMLDNKIAQHRIEQSGKFYELLKTRSGRPFMDEYKRQKNAQTKLSRTEFANPVELDNLSLKRAMEFGETPRGMLRRRQEQPLAEGEAYPDGVLAFVGYMLSYRWANLKTYCKAFSTHDEAIGVDRVLGALVDFDRWLDCPPRSAHEDQMRLHARLSKMSGGYMLPLISYNPWTDVAVNGRSLKLVKQAVTEFGFVGAKIYPPNGFRPWGNTKEQDGFRLPSHAKINQALEAFWDTCIELNIPVLAHTGQSMGKDDAHDLLGGPDGWNDLISAYASKGRSPLVSLGHFGGDEEKQANTWTELMSKLMDRPNADKVYGDLGYWSELRCDEVGSTRCNAAENRLRNILNTGLVNQNRVADRVMFGSDWFMISKERNWSDYASELFSTIKGIAPDDVEKIFGKNAIKCFGPKIAPT